VRKGVEIGNGADESGEARSRGSKARGGGKVVRGDEAEGVGRERGERRIVSFESGAKRAEGREASLRARGRERLRAGVEEEGVRLGERSGAGGRGMGSEVGLRKGDGEGGIGGEIESWVTLSPVPRSIVSDEGVRGNCSRVLLDHGDVDGCCGTSPVDFLVRHDKETWRINFLHLPQTDDRCNPFYTDFVGCGGVIVGYSHAYCMLG
jgi:hypothetical protein